MSVLSNDRKDRYESGDKVQGRFRDGGLRCRCTAGSRDGIRGLWVSG